MGNQSKFRIIEKQRKLVTYQITDSEMDSLGSLTRIEQVLLNAFFAFAGSAFGTGVTILSGATGVPVYTAFWVSLVLTITLLIACISIMQAMKRMKKDIRDE
jgi:hypothetical protein